MDKKGIFWIRDDFRIRDNTALSYASHNHDIVSAIYIYDRKIYDGKREAQKWWLYKSLKNFQKDLENFKINLEIIESDQVDFFKKINSKDAISFYWNKIYEPEEIKKENKIINILNDKKILYKNFKGNVLNEYFKITKNDGSPFKVYSPFWRNAENFYIENIPSNNRSLKKLKKIFKVFNSKFDVEKILPSSNWYKKFERYWDPSESEADKLLKKFISDKIKQYGSARDFPSINGTSRLSPYIRNGQINVNNIWKKCNEIKIKNLSIKKYVNEIGWREFSHSLINNFPEMLKGNLRKEFDKFPWVKNYEFLEAWKKGLTGYPIVDAGMRQLYETGWMHNRIRMVVGSFLVKHLRINWKEGERYFRNCLLDFNEANNVAQWQWVAGCGADAAPYFRIFNPILQGEKFDKDGSYVKKWVPELEKVPNKLIHKPWEMEKKFQEAIKTIIGKDYPNPIVIHEIARNEALKAFQSIRKN